MKASGFVGMMTSFRILAASVMNNLRTRVAPGAAADTVLDSLFDSESQRACKSAWQRFRPAR